MSQQEKQRPLFMEYPGQRALLMAHVPDSTFSPKFKNQVILFLHLMCKGDLRIDTENGADQDGAPARPIDMCSYFLQNVLRWWAQPTNPKPAEEPYRFSSENATFHTSEAEAEAAEFLGKLLPNGAAADVKTAFALAGNEEFQARYMHFFLAQCNALAAKKAYLDEFLPAKIDPDVFQTQTHFLEYLLNSWRMRVDVGAMASDMTRQLNEVAIDTTVSFKQIAMQLQKNISIDSGRAAIRNGEEIVSYTLVYFFNFKSVGFDQPMPTKNTKNTQYTSCDICPFTTQQNNTLSNIMMGSITYRPENKTESPHHTALTRVYLLDNPNNPPKAHSARLELDSNFKTSFFDACNSHTVSSEIPVDIFKDGTIYMTVYPSDCMVTLPSLLFRRLQSADLNYKFSMPNTEDLELNSIDKVYSIFGFLGEAALLKDIAKPPRELRMLDRRQPYNPHKTIVYEGQCEPIKCSVQEFPHSLRPTIDRERPDITLLEERVEEFSSLATLQEKNDWLKAYWSDASIQKLIEDDMKWRARDGLNKYKQEIYDSLVDNKNYTCLVETSIGIQTSKDSKTTKVLGKKMKFTAKKRIAIIAVNNSGVEENSGEDYDRSYDNDDADYKKRRPATSGGFTQAKRSKRD